nr:hypothetical protein [Tanacetum cinerariifolium]
MVALVISISSDVSVESVGSSFLRVILISSISVEVPVAPEVGAAAVASPAGVLELDTHSSSEADPSKSSSPPASVAPMVSPFLCSDDSELDTEMPEKHVSPTPHDVMLTKTTYCEVWVVQQGRHMARDCKNAVAIPTTQRVPVVNQGVPTCFECGMQGHYRNEFPKLKNHNRGNDMFQKLKIYNDENTNFIIGKHT